MTPAATAGAPDRTFPAYLVRGDDTVLVGDAAHGLVRDLVGDAEVAFVVEDLSGDDFELSQVIDAAQTPPFLTDRRVVVARGLRRFSSEELQPLLDYLADPLSTTALVLVDSGGKAGQKLSQKLVNAVKKVGHVVEAGTPDARQREAWVRTQIKDAGLRFDPPAAKLLVDHTGDDVSRLPGLLRVLTEAYGDGARIGDDELAPFLGDAGGVAPWLMTDAIDEGDTELALEQLHRMLDGGRRHPLEMTAILQSHYGRMLRLEGAEVGGEAEAAELLGLKGSTYPAKKALRQVRRLGREGVRRAILLLHQADLDLKGDREIPGAVVLEVLVARLSRLGATAGARRGGGRVSPG